MCLSPGFHPGNFFSYYIWAMAVIQTTAIVAGVTGKLAGTVARRHRGQIVLSNKVTPKRTMSAKDSRAKGIFREIVASWKQRTQSARNQWIDAAKEYSRLMKNGEKFTMSGFQYYVQCNLVRRQGNTSLITLPQPLVPYNAGKVYKIEASAALNRVYFYISGSTSSGSWVYEIKTQPLTPPSISPRFKDLTNAMRHTVLPGSYMVSYSGTTLGITVKSGMRLNVQVLPVRTLSGQIWFPFNFSIIVP